MNVNNLMVPKGELITVTREDNIEVALDLIEKNDFLSVPIVEKNKFYGAISKENIFEFYYKTSKELGKVTSLSDYKVKEVMNTEIPKIHSKELVENAVNLLYINKADFVAVLDDAEEFKGILAHKAIFKEFTEVFGLNKGNRIAVTAYDIPGQISKLTRIISENKGDIISCVVEDPKSRLGVKEVALRISTDDFDSLVQKIEHSGFKLV